MRALLKHGADPKLTTKDGSDALQFAAGVGYRDKNTKGGTESEALEAKLKLTVSLGMDINRENNKGDVTALHGAASRGADTVVQYLMEQSAKLNAKSKIRLNAARLCSGQERVRAVAGTSRQYR